MLADKAMLSQPAWNDRPNTPWPPMHVETRNSIAYRVALVAKGEFDAMIALSAKCDWDLAAAEIIVEEAGGIATSHNGSPLLYNRPDAIQPSIVAAGAPLHAEMIERVKHISLQNRQDRT
jgi:myo-inositol-1(or 4)-monophosphatase